MAEIQAFNPVTGQYETIDSTDSFYRAGGDNAQWGDVNGKRTLILKTDGWEQYGNDVHGLDGPVWTFGADPAPGATAPGYAPGDEGLVFGPGDDGVFTPGAGAGVGEPALTPQPPSGGGDPFQPPAGGGGSPTAPPYPGTNDTSWDWGQGPVTGEYFGSPPTNTAQTMPGQDSPWGVPDTPGGNKEFYRQQFSNLLSQQNDFQKAQQQAALIRQEAANNPQESDITGWQDRAYGGKGIPKIQMGTGQPSVVSHQFNDAYAGMGLGDIFDQVKNRSVFNSSQSSKSQEEVLNGLFNTEKRYSLFEGFDPSQYKNAGDAFSALNPDAWKGMNRPNVAEEGLRTVLNQVYTPDAFGPSAPQGYAAPVNWSGA